MSLKTKKETFTNNKIAEGAIPVEYRYLVKPEITMTEQARWRPGEWNLRLPFKTVTHQQSCFSNARVVELADMPDLGSGAK